MHLFKKRVLFSFIVFLIVGFDKAGAQSIPVPYMWVDSFTSIQRKTNFNVKHFLLGKDENDSITYSIRSFQKMIQDFKKTFDALVYDSLHIYLASFSKEGDPMVPQTYGNKLTFIFAPAKENTNLGYYILPPGIDAMFDLTKCKLTAKITEDWKLNYYNKKMSKILATINEEDRDNYDKKGVFSDTKIITYSRENFEQLDKEVDYQRTQNHIIINGIKAFFAAYLNDGNHNGEYKNRLILQFEFTRGLDYKIFYIESQRDFAARKAISKFFGFNNGQLCPANCPQ